MQKCKQQNLIETILIVVFLRRVKYKAANGTFNSEINENHEKTTHKKHKQRIVKKHNRKIAEKLLCGMRN